MQLSGTSEVMSSTADTKKKKTREETKWFPGSLVVYVWELVYSYRIISWMTKMF